MYAFLPKSLLGGVKSFWHIETSLIARRRTATAWYHDRRIRYTLELLVGSTFLTARSFRVEQAPAQGQAPGTDPSNPAPDIAPDSDEAPDEDQTPGS